MIVPAHVNKTYAAPHLWPIKAVTVVDAGYQGDPRNAENRRARLQIVFPDGRRLALSVPKGYWAEEEEELKGHSEVLFWKVHTHFVLVWFCGNDPLMFTFHTPFFYQVGKNSIKILRQPMRREGYFASIFPRVGSCMVHHGQFLTWDVELDDHRPWCDPHRYRLSYFDLIGGRIRRVEYKITKRFYLPIPDFESPTINPKQDPLREFGLCWKWWDQR